MAPVSRELAGVERLSARAERLLELSETRLLRRDESRSGWSPAEHLFHLAFANEMSLKNAANLVSGKGALIRPRGELVPQVLDVLRRGRLARGAEAPRFVRPPPVIDFDFLREIVSGVRAAVARLAADPAALETAPDGIPHQILGVLSAAQWVRFARMHSAHHLVIVRGLLSA